MALARGKSLLFIFLLLVVPSFFMLKWENDGNSFRGQIDVRPIELSPCQIPGNIEHLEHGERIFSLRKGINLSQIPGQFLEAMLLLEETPSLIQNYKATELAASNGTLFAAPEKRGSGNLVPILDLDGGYGPNIFTNFLHNNSEALDLQGKPVRFKQSQQFLAGISPPRPWLELEKEKPAAKIPKIPAGASTNYYHDLAISFARRFGLNVPLVLAIIYSESNFRPTLVSSKSAMGLMQLLPSTASGEVHKFLYGKSGNVGYDDLSNPETNIRYGTAYLHILLNRYFPGVKNREVRETCVIAAYNLGPNRFIRLYGANPEAAADIINKMDPEEFLEDLQRRLPARETRNFVEKVRRMKNHYTMMD